MIFNDLQINPYTKETPDNTQARRRGINHDNYYNNGKGKYAYVSAKIQKKINIYITPFHLITLSYEVSRQ